MNAHRRQKAKKPERHRVVLSLTSGQSLVVKLAVLRVREIVGDPTISVSRCIELMCADFLSGH